MQAQVKEWGNSQGDILRIEKIKHPVLAVSKDFFNTSGEVIDCPISEMPNVSDAIQGIFEYI